ncbi:uncharacterized protein LOC131927739 isoform X2 [Physella acuta]|uniref:uncharacterized protein LOC131927739 isoform X2 n=1 Tax=Physella acuta TaxID=109671 RepID=UPI0027DE9DE7|nr:uncharacterized protein LOC131927739 isoform X2 [Physella acuta]
MEWEPQRPTAPSTPSSTSSYSAGNSGARAEKIPVLKQITPSPSVAALSKLTDDELRRKGVEDLVRILRRVEGDYKYLLGEHGNVIKDVNRRFQIFLLEVRSLKEFNQKLQDDNQELRDLCCFLDDDRQRGRKLAREWQRFGRYTASVMKSEVAAYQDKLRELEDRQNDLVMENLELKELCIYLDQERARVTGDRDEGDGSSNGTVTGHEDGVVAMDTAHPMSSIAHTGFASTTANYVRELEIKIHQLEEEKKLLAQRIGSNSLDGLDNILIDGINTSTISNDQVLQVHEELEKTPTEEDLDDPEKAIVREMCNVVWRKLGDVGDVGRFNDSTDSILDPPYLSDSPGKPPSMAYSNYIPQPQPQMASTPLSATVKPTVGKNQYGQAGLEPQPTSYPFHPQNLERYAPRPHNEMNRPSHPSQSSTTHLFPQNQTDSDKRGQLGLGLKTHMPDRADERRNPDPTVVPRVPIDSNKYNQPLPSHHFQNDPNQQLQSQHPQHLTQPQLYSSQRPIDPARTSQPSQHPPPPVTPRYPGQPNPAPSSALPQQFASYDTKPTSQQRNPPVRSLDNAGAHRYGYSESQKLPPSSQGLAAHAERDDANALPVPRPLSRGENRTEDRNYLERDAQIRQSARSLTSSSALNQQPQGRPHPLAAPHQNAQGPAGFRAYPPQLNSMPTQSWGGGIKDPAGHFYQQDSKMRPNHYQVHPGQQGYNAGSQVKGNKRFQEQEWRQNYLEDSDTL